MSEKMISINTNLSFKRISDVVCSAIESSYGTFYFIKDGSKKPSNIDELPNNKYPHLSWFFSDGEVVLEDKYTEEKHKLTEAGLCKGLQILHDKYPHHFSDIIQENDDVITGDCFLQCAVFGDVIYG